MYLEKLKAQISGEIPLEIGRLDRLTSLYLNNNQLIGFIPLELGIFFMWMKKRGGGKKLSKRVRCVA